MREHKFQRAPKDVSARAAVIIGQYHEPLKAAKVKIDFVFCRAETDSKGKTKSYSLARKGKRLFEITSIMPLIDRAMGRGDAQIKLDADSWDAMKEEQRDAVLDHAISHLRIKKDEVDAPMVDDLGRPCLEMRPYDFEFGWFKDVAERHGAASIEISQAQEIQQKAGQILFQFELVNIVPEESESVGTPQPQAAALPTR